MKITKPKMELTNNEVDAINTVIWLCKELSSVDDDFFDFILKTDDANEDFAEVINILDNVLDSSEYEKKGNKKNDAH